MRVPMASLPDGFRLCRAKELVLSELCACSLCVRITDDNVGFGHRCPFAACRSRRRGDGDPTLLPSPTAHDPVNQVLSTEELHSLVNCLSSVLSELESSVLSLYLDGNSYEVIGERLECDTKTVDNALQRVKRKVGSHLGTRAVPA